ncbi:MAG: Gfo/Idh/MocA family protein [Candidatus Caldatribacteriaceae bacterium]
MGRVALLGAGFIASVHMEAWRKIEGATVSAFFETNPEKAQAFREKYGIPHYDSFGSLLKNEDVDMVDVCLPTFLHREYVEMSASAGKHVFCEKPIALNVEDAEAMQESCQRNGVAFMVGHVLRFWGEYVKAKELLNQGAIGKPLAVEAFRLSVSPTWSVDSWILRPELSGGAALDLHIHDCDYVNWILGTPREVFAWGVRSAARSWDHIFTEVRYEGGVVASIQGGWMMKGDFPFTCGYRILGEKGILEWTFRAGVNIEERGQSNPIFLYQEGKERQGIGVASEDPYYLELRYFFDCVRERKPVQQGTPEQAILALKVALAAQAASEKSTVIQL